MASIKDAHEIASDSRKPLILLTFLTWHLFRTHNTTKKGHRQVSFFRWLRRQGLSLFFSGYSDELRSLGERTERRRWRKKRGERVAAVAEGNRAPSRADRCGHRNRASKREAFVRKSPEVMWWGSHLRNQKRKQSYGLLFCFWNDVFRKRNVMHT